MRAPCSAIRSTLVAVTLACLTACGGDDQETATASSVSSPPTAPAPGNTAPTIGGQPVTALRIGESYYFQPSAADTDGETLRFTVSNLPRWASFSATTGRLVGTPGAGDVGSYSGITLSVSDGKTSTALGSFSIAVTAVGIGSATLSWLPPVANVDSSPLTDLAGYRIRYGRSSGALDQSIAVGNPSLTSYVIENLSAGTWYFAIVVFKTSGSESVLSNLASKRIS